MLQQDFHRGYDRKTFFSKTRRYFDWQEIRKASWIFNFCFEVKRMRKKLEITSWSSKMTLRNMIVFEIVWRSWDSVAQRLEICDASMDQPIRLHVHVRREEVLPPAMASSVRYVRRWPLAKVVCAFSRIFRSNHARVPALCDSRVLEDVAAVKQSAEPARHEARGDIRDVRDNQDQAEAQVCTGLCVRDRCEIQ